MNHFITNISAYVVIAYLIVVSAAQIVQLVRIPKRLCMQIISAIFKVMVTLHPHNIVVGSILWFNVSVT